MLKRKKKKRRKPASWGKLKYSNLIQLEVEKLLDIVTNHAENKITLLKSLSGPALKQNLT